MSDDGLLGLVGKDAYTRMHRLEGLELLRDFIGKRLWDNEGNIEFAQRIIDALIADAARPPRDEGVSE